MLNKTLKTYIRGVNHASAYFIPTACILFDYRKRKLKHQAERK